MFKRKNPGKPGWVLLVLAAVLLLLLAGAQGYVSWQAQYTFIFAAKHAQWASVLEALGLDTAAIIFALLGLAHARMGRSAVIERTLNLLCVGGSMTMNLLSAQLGSPRSVAVYVLPAVLYAACSDRLIATVGHMSGVQETTSMWRVPGVAFLYLLRLAVAFPSTATGMRRRLLELTPLPESTRKQVRARDQKKVQDEVPETEDESVPRRPLIQVLRDAEKKYTADLTSGTLPGHRQIRRDLQVGQKRAEQVREHLKAQAPAAVANPDSDDTQVFSTVGHPSPGQNASSYQHLPVTPQGR